MTRDPPAEGPEHRTQTLSPVSPKPLHFPSPANIPVLENQMDPLFNDTSTHSNHNPNPNPPATPQGEPKPPQAPLTADSDPESGPDVLSEKPLDGDEAIRELSLGASHETTTASENGLQPASLTYGSTTGNSLNDHNGAEDDNANQESSFTYIPLQPQHVDAPTATSIAPTSSISGDQAENPLGDASQLQQVPPMHTGVNMSAANAIDIQALLDNLISPSSLSNPPSAHAVTSTAAQHAEGSEITPGVIPSSTDASNPYASLTNLPPRPPSSTPTILPPHAESQDQLPLASSNPTSPASASLPNQTYAPLSHAVPPPLPTAGAPGTSFPGANGLPPPPVPAFQQQQGPSLSDPSLTATVQFQDQADFLSKQRTDEQERNADADIPWGAEIQKKYDAFLEEERKYVLEGQWDRFPVGSRLFIGNLPSEKVTKRDLFHVFHKHGPLAQISIKQAYGFIQYLKADDCDRALRLEQSVAIRGRKIHLEISKPQRNTKNASGGENRSSRNRRSRSPEHSRSGSGAGQRGTDRYRGGTNNRNGRAQDHYRPGRSPSPRRNNGDAYRRRSPDRYDGRRRSRSPYSRSRHRSPSPIGGDDDSSLPLPRRSPDQVPDVQLISQDHLDRKFFEYIESTFAQRGVRVDVLILGSKLNEAAVMRRQILEGVQAVMKLSRLNQAMQKFQLSVFDRSAGVNSVRFEEYDQLDLHICVELVVRAKQSKRAPLGDVSQYGLPITPATGSDFQTPNNPLAGPYAAPGAPQINMSSAISGMDHSSLQQLLDTLSKPQRSPTTPQGPPQISPQPYALQTQHQRLGHGPPTPQGQQEGQQGNSYVMQPNYSSHYGGIPGGSPLSPTQPAGAGQQQGPPDMQNIMAQLARYGR